MTELDLSKKVALVTGAASGIGAACVRRLAQSGATVIGVDIDDAAGEALFAELNGAHRYWHLNVAEPGDWRRVLGQVKEAFGPLDIVLLNAGVMSRPKGAPLLDAPLDWFTEGAYEKVRRVNQDGVVYGLMTLIEQGGAPRIVVTASGAAISPLPLDPFYTATKYAVLGLGLALAPSLAERGMRIDVICPGAIDTPITAPDIRASYKQEPPSFIANALLEVLSQTAAPNNAWLAYNEEEGVQAYSPGAGALEKVQTTR
ncbi:SDR family oxidoreductase [Burkholderia multivorans]|uniref:SDR family oxidoreductase n=1 Tax=Burkholderia multivorans TaxID=87883 RepID=UPI0019D0F73E|nr:SDR family NAD(P)-dependent oxidoreductase [Burkholderia multivorans]MBN6731274.1 SDR family oxidoreductase [Burkholderia multivorans]MBN6733456.1 SDR family oxidoreductase [Burkholderia multivorans]MBN7130373.1 SDR family oxidoreductase [Burkholderia multivorans]MBN8165088.1 SDR family oxidoreductase [Burkholderia multivorans]MBN8170877.1 SDR family oxidoreductase [Burkholderia multivorans]